MKTQTLAYILYCTLCSEILQVYGKVISVYSWYHFNAPATDIHLHVDEYDGI